MIGLGAAWLVWALALPAPQGQVAADTVVFSAAEALERAVVTAPGTEAARRRLAAARSRTEQARAWHNPTLSVTAENLGASRAVSGVPGVGGVEGQAVLSGWLPLGGDRSAARALSEAWADEAGFALDGFEADARLALIEAWAYVRRDRARLGGAREESAGLDALARTLAAQAELGRVATGEAARAHLAMVSGRAAAAEVSAQAASSEEALNRVLGLPPGSSAFVGAGTCAPTQGGVGTPQQPPELLAALARSRAAAASVAESEALRIPDVLPQVGVRRVGGTSALYAGISIALPLFDRGGAAVRGARHDEAAAAADVARVEQALSSELEAARRGLAALLEAGELYGATWEEALEQSVSSAEARYQLGEGTLTELLDGRRARLQALDAHERWKADVLVQRARVARLSGVALDAALLCTDSRTETPNVFDEEGPR